MYNKMTLKELKELASSELFYNFVNSNFLNLTKQIYNLNNMNFTSEKEIVGIIYYHKKPDGDLFYRSYKLVLKTGYVKFTAEKKVVDKNKVIQYEKLKYNFYSKTRFFYK